MRTLVALLRHIAPRVGEQVLQIARLCGNLPIALRLAGGALAEQPWLQPAEYARRLTEAQTRLGLIEGTLKTSYELLSEELQALWRMLAVFPGTFDAAAAAAVWERKLRAAEEALGELARSSLVEWEEEGEGEPGRFRLHDLARVFADTRLSEIEREAARRLHAAHYRQVLSAADDLYLKEGEALLQGLRLFDREWGNVRGRAGLGCGAGRRGRRRGWTVQRLPGCRRVLAVPAPAPPRAGRLAGGGARGRAAQQGPRRGGAQPWQPRQRSTRSWARRGGRSSITSSADHLSRDRPPPRRG